MNVNEILDCPRCNRVVVIKEGFAYCEGCGGLYMTEAEEQRRREKLFRATGCRSGEPGKDPTTKNK
jgi:hypothetical protein